MKILITGVGGFIFSHFADYMRFLGHEVVGVDAMLEGSCVNNMAAGYDRDSWIVRVEDLTLEGLKFHKFDYIVHGAALSNVDTSIKSPRIFESNVAATSNICWLATQLEIPIVVVSSDEVYGSYKDTKIHHLGGYTEKDDLKPSSPYAASKAASDLIALSYYKTFGSNVKVTRGSNTYGIRQQDKLIPTIFKKTFLGERIPIFKTPALRDWIHVQDHCSGIYKVMTDGKAGEVYNISANNELSPLQVVEMAVGTSMVDLVEDRKGYDLRYFCSSKKLRDLGWEPKADMQKELSICNEWYSWAYETGYFNK